ncbi:MAG: M20/M25/M40 family metallo-hydrolase, partial [Flavisolibacter sp.]|nr:M20/M25/M40 family metallo-hydrolase [Flavisolibacter sp.]
HDTVKPNLHYTRNPFEAIVEEGKLYGLGSNDAGGALVSLIAAFLHFYERDDIPFNVIMAATAEEEISGINGVELTLKHLPPIAAALVGEPTQLQLAVAEKGLLVLDCMVQGKAGHAAREEGDNAVYKALPDIEWFKDFRFQKISNVLGEVKMSVTVIETENKAHNVVPAQCRFVVDIRVTDTYTHEEIMDIIRQHVNCTVTPRSMRLRSTRIAEEHPLVLAGKALGKKVFGSPTCSDKGLMPFPALKCGPGDSARSHTADEFIYVQEIEEGIEFYIALLNKVFLQTPFSTSFVLGAPSPWRREVE